MLTLFQGFLDSNWMGRGIVLFQLAGSLVMFGVIFRKFVQFKALGPVTRRVSRDVMSGHDVLEYYLARHPSTHTPIETIYTATCERFVKLIAPDERSLLLNRRAGGMSQAALTGNEMTLVKSLCEHTLDEEEIRVERGMGVIVTVVSLAPMLGLLGTVWGVLDAFADMGAAGSATIATMAPAISSALVTTVVGLLIAIPGVVVYNALNATLRDIVTDMEGFAEDLMGRIALEFQGREE